VRLSEHWERLPWEVMVSLSLETGKGCQDMVLGSPLWVTVFEGAA